MACECARLAFWCCTSPSGTAWQRKVLTVVFWGGISTSIWGFLFGGILGFSIPPLLFAPLNSPLNMLVLCLGLGLSHIIFGMAVGAYMAFRRGRIADAVFNYISWILVFICNLVGALVGVRDDRINDTLDSRHSNLS